MIGVDHSDAAAIVEASQREDLRCIGDPTRAVLKPPAAPPRATIATRQGAGVCGMRCVLA